MHARLKKEFTEDEKYCNLMGWLNYQIDPNWNESTAQQSTGSRFVHRNATLPRNLILTPCSTLQIMEQTLVPSVSQADTTIIKVSGLLNYKFSRFH